VRDLLAIALGGIGGIILASLLTRFGKPIA
jgi:hypothetical protein